MLTIKIAAFGSQKTQEWYCSDQCISNAWQFDAAGSVIEQYFWEDE